MAPTACKSRAYQRRYGAPPFGDKQNAFRRLNEVASFFHADIITWAHLALVRILAHPICGSFGEHDYRRIGIAAGDARHDRSVHHPQAVSAVHF